MSHSLRLSNTWTLWEPWRNPARDSRKKSPRTFEELLPGPKSQSPDLPSGLKPNAQHVFEAFRCTLGHTWSHGCGRVNPFPHLEHQIIINLNPSNLGLSIEAEAFPKRKRIFQAQFFRCYNVVGFSDR